MQYRVDIQIIRGLAVLLVVLYHLSFTNFKAGFLGVDMFFVISGFLMSKMYINGYFQFTYNRLKRLLPAYFATTFTFLLVAYFFLQAGELVQTKYSAISSALFLSNIVNSLTVSYFSDEFFNLFLHHWSLAVEVQFYLIVPLLVFLFRKSKLSLIIIFTFSLILCLVTVLKYENFAFYLTPFRIWEFLVGMAIVHIVPACTIRENTKIKIFIITIIVLFLFIFFYPKIINLKYSWFVLHPGFGAFVSTLIVGFLIYLNVPNKALLGVVPSFFETMGKYSYSIYLVHFPIILLFTYVPLSGVTVEYDNVTLIYMFITIFFLSLFSYHFFEQYKTFKVFLSALILLVSLGSALGIYIKPATLNENVYKAGLDRSEFRCGRLFAYLNPNADVCFISDEHYDKSLILIGNSHADSLKDDFEHVASNFGYGVYFLVRNNPLMKGGLRADELINVMNYKDIKLAVLHYSPKAIEINNLKEFLILSSLNNIEVKFLESVPVYNEHIPKFLEHKSPQPEYLKPKEVDSSELLYTLKKYNVEIIPTQSVFCEKDKCRVLDHEKNLLYFDQGHLTKSGSAFLSNQFELIFN